MKERPIIFSGDMVKALLAGTKTQTRRVVADKRLSPKLTLLELFDFLGGGGKCDGTGWQADDEGLLVSFVKDFDRKNDDGRRYKYTGLLVQSAAVPNDGAEEIVCPYGVAGDRLWVRETFTITRYTLTARSVGSLVRLQGHYKDGIAFDVTLTASESLKYYNWKRKTGTFPAIFMFRSLSRALLDLLKVGAERLQDISESDAMAEGIETSAAVEAWRAGHGGFGPVTGMNAHKMAYARLWDSLHGKGAWVENPWVWVLEFQPLRRAA